MNCLNKTLSMMKSLVMIFISLMMMGPLMMSLVMMTLVTLTLEMGRRKTKLRTRSKSVIVERASSQDVDEVGDQETHEASTQDVQPPVRVTRGPSKYLNIWDLPDEEEIKLPLNSMHQLVDDGARTFTGFLGTIVRKPHMCLIRFLNWKDVAEEFKEECWCLVERKYSVPVDPIACAALKTFTLQKIGKAWRDHKSRLKKQHYIPHSRNKARVKNNIPPGCITQDWEILVEHWYTDDAMVCLFFFSFPSWIISKGE
ncbi:uncharacterized protein LOC115986409 isoform X2 [Quercus lobata]|uniref:uncharacterized protein LOC115986409 isoform X2 n=1 Tax=Quercus lobata TaxID=97700 RepID=UPI001245F3FD|nr:uncharacterized protein LOC115986409 isoform X2 [Quercus lobata]